MSQLKLALPKGRMEKGVLALLHDARIDVRAGNRAYRPVISLPEFEVKILKPQNIVEMLHHGVRDVGFAGADWVAELGVELIELLDTGLDPVSLVAAAPVALVENDAFRGRNLMVASEYERLTKQWIAAQGLSAQFVHSYGATEVFPPDDADLIVDNTATGATLRANGLEIIDKLMSSSTRLYANPKVMEDPARRSTIESFALLLRSVLDARTRVMVEVNISRDKLDALVSVLPCMREPTIASLHNETGYAVKVAVPRESLPRLIPEIRARGGTDIVVMGIAQLVV